MACVSWRAMNTLLWILAIVAVVLLIVFLAKRV
jgi:hypothetical protein